MLNDFYFERLYPSKPQDTSEDIQSNLTNTININSLESLIFIRLHKRLFSVCTNDAQFFYMFEAMKNLAQQSLRLQERAKRIN